MSNDLTRFTPTSGGFAGQAFTACFAISASLNTRRAYWTDVRHWLAFCLTHAIDPAKPPAMAVIAWVEEMRQGQTAPKTRGRRISALSSVYNRLRRDGIVEINPFSVENGPQRETMPVIKPTPMVSPGAVQRILATCDGSLEGIRDEAIIRFLWATGARRNSLTQMSLERLQAEQDTFIAMLIGKGQKEIRVLVRGRAAKALERWLELLRASKITSGAIWRSSNGTALIDKDIGNILRRRTKQAMVDEHITPHTFRVAFLTLNPARLEAKQDAVGHADPATTRLYDRNWRGREAFEAMPEIEDLV